MDYSPLGSFSMEFFRQEHLSALPFPSPGNLPNSEIRPKFAVRPVNSLPLNHLGSPYVCVYVCITESLCCTPEIKTNLQINNTPVGEKKRGKESAEMQERVLNCCPSFSLLSLTGGKNVLN